MTTKIYPEECYTCGEKIGKNKYLLFIQNKENVINLHASQISDEDLINFVSMKDSLDIMKIKKPCCRRMYLQHPNLPEVKEQVTLI